MLGHDEVYEMDHDLMTLPHYRRPNTIPMEIGALSHDY